VEVELARHLCDLGRHYFGSNWFWYLREPSGAITEYYADMDVITDAATWEAASIADRRALAAWAPPLPPEFVAGPEPAVTEAPGR